MAVGMVGTTEEIGRRFLRLVWLLVFTKVFLRSIAAQLLVKLATLITCKTKSCRESRFFFRVVFLVIGG